MSANQALLLRFAAMCHACSACPRAGHICLAATATLSRPRHGRRGLVRSASRPCMPVSRQTYGALSLFMPICMETCEERHSRQADRPSDVWCWPGGRQSIGTVASTTRTRRNKDDRPAARLGRPRLPTLPDRTSWWVADITIMCRQWRFSYLAVVLDALVAVRLSAGLMNKPPGAPNWCWMAMEDWLFWPTSAQATLSTDSGPSLANIPRWHSASGVARQVFDPQWGRSATPTTTPWPRASSTLEAELLSRRRFASQAEAKMACFSYIEGWYNPMRLHSGLGYRSPITYEADMQAAMTKT